MTAEDFRSEVTRARLMRNLATDIHGPYYWTGYEWDLHRAFHRQNFGTAEQREQRMELANDPIRANIGRGYDETLRPIRLPPPYPALPDRHHGISARVRLLLRAVFS
jgi:hypothetical protein